MDGQCRIGSRREACVGLVRPLVTHGRYFVVGYYVVRKRLRLNNPMTTETIRG
jgi:hypothetical protein